MNAAELAGTLAGELTQLRHRLHRLPEMGLSLPRSQDAVLQALDGLGLEISTGDALSSVTAVLRGGSVGGPAARGLSGDAARPVVMLRADMDALPILEATDSTFRSEVDGLMHACGHDVHTTMLVGAAQVLAQRRAHLRGDVVFMFQPGEEGFDGAQLMIDEGVMTAAGRVPDAAYALHVMSAGFPRHVVAARPGPMMAASDALYVTITGLGGHGSRPHKARDPVPALGEMIQGLHPVATRTVGPFETGLITVGRVAAGTRRNIIPDTAEFDATIRTVDPDVRERLSSALVSYCEGVAAAHGLEVDVRFVTEYPVTVNHPDEVDFSRTTVLDLFGDDAWHDMVDPVAGAEDFSRVLQRVPGAMLFLGAQRNGRDPESAPDNHSALAEFDDSVIPRGAALLAELASRRLRQPGRAEQPEQPERLAG